MPTKTRVDFLIAAKGGRIGSARPASWIAQIGSRIPGQIGLIQSSVLRCLSSRPLFEYFINYKNRGRAPGNHPLRASGCTALMAI